MIGTFLHIYMVLVLWGIGVILNKGRKSSFTNITLHHKCISGNSLKFSGRVLLRIPANSKF